MNKNEKKYVQVYTGDGKGKTTAAIGLAVRASGYGMKTYIGQFMKGQHYGELTALKKNPFITIEQYGNPKCIRKKDITQKHITRARAGLEKALNAMLSDRYDILVLDEINVAVWYNLVTIEDVLEFLDKRPDHIEVILTGRNAPDELLEVADIISEMKKIKHYYDDGILARKGIER